MYPTGISAPGGGVMTGKATPLPGNGTFPARTAGPHQDQALLMSPAERADVIVDFSQFPIGTVTAA